MINIEDIKPVLALLSSRSEEELSELEPVIGNAAAVVSRLVEEELHSDERVIYLAAAKANYELSLISASDGVASFTAGDVSITQGAAGQSAAKAILDEAMRNASDLVCDNGFAFLGV